MPMGSEFGIYAPMDYRFTPLIFKNILS